MLLSTVKNQRNYQPLIIFQGKSLDLESIKHWVNKSIHLKLFDPQTPTYIFTDASIIGAAAFVSFQHVISDGNPVNIALVFYLLKFTPTQQLYSSV